MSYALRWLPAVWIKFPDSQLWVSGRTYCGRTQRARTRTVQRAHTRRRHRRRNVRTDRWQWKSAHTTTCREGHTCINDLPTAPENKACIGSAQPLMYRGYGQRTPPFIPHDSEKSYERDSYYSTTGNYWRTHQPDEEGSSHWPTLGRLNPYPTLKNPKITH